MQLREEPNAWEEGPREPRGQRVRGTAAAEWRCDVPSPGEALGTPALHSVLPVPARPYGGPCPARLHAGSVPAARLRWAAPG